jgi:hypothetical protein
MQAVVEEQAGEESGDDDRCGANQELQQLPEIADDDLRKRPAQQPLDPICLRIEDHSRCVNVPGLS